jgi:hypothetical protein
MAHFAELDENNVVKQVIVVHNNELKGANGVEYENKGIEFCNSLFGHTNWVQTSYNSNMRKQFAGVGFTYDDVNDVFVAPQPFPSWSLDENYDWQPPVEYPSDEIGENQNYVWNEETQSWDLITIE